MFYFTDYFNIFLPRLFIDSHLLVSKRSNFINNQPSTFINPSYYGAFWPKHTTKLYFQTVFFTQRCRRNLSFIKYNTSNTNLNRELHHERMETTITLSKIIQAFVYTCIFYLKVTIFLMGEDLISSVCTENRMKTFRWFGVLLKLLNLKVN